MSTPNVFTERWSRDGINVIAENGLTVFEQRDPEEEHDSGSLARARDRAAIAAASPEMLRCLDDLLHGYLDYCKRYDIHPQKCAENARNAINRAKVRP